ncbi:MAG: helix-turn-helix domain-containing protein [Armatimonadota bacterium]
MSIESLNERIRNAANRETYHVAKAIERVTETIYEIMEADGITQTELASRLGNTQSWVSKLLQGKQNMTIATAVKVFRALGYEYDPQVRFLKTDHANCQTECNIVTLNEYLGDSEYERAA